MKSLYNRVVGDTSGVDSIIHDGMRIEGGFVGRVIKYMWS